MRDDHEIDGTHHEKREIRITGEKMGQLNMQHGHRQQGRGQQTCRNAIQPLPQQEGEQDGAGVDQRGQEAPDGRQMMVLDPSRPVQHVGRQAPARGQYGQQYRSCPFRQPRRRHAQI